MNKYFSLPTGPKLRYLPKGLFSILFIFLFLLNSGVGFGQNSVTINSAEENFTNINPVPVEITFEKGIDQIDPKDFQYINGDLINFDRQDPEYWQLREDLLIEKFNFSANAFELVLSPNPGNVLLDRLSKTVIAISQLNISELLFLKYGDGTDILNLNSGNRKETDIVAGDLSSPLDIEAYFNEMVYLADNEAQDIKVYNNVPQFVTTITPIDDDASEDLGPTSLATDSDGNLYITVAHNGTNKYDNVDRVYIYDNNRNLTYEIEDGNNYELNSPYKIAVDNAGKLYVVDAGSSDDSNGRILVFELNGTTYDLIEIIEGAEDDLNSPGSIVVDDFGYIYVVDYLEQIVFNKIFEEPLSFILNYNDIKNSNFPVKVFDPNFNYVTEISGLNLPVDIELDHCGNLLVNNLEIKGDDINEEDMIGPYPTSVNNDFEFTLKTFTRRDIFIADFEINQQCKVASFTIPAGLENISNCSVIPEAKETFSIILDKNAPVVTTCYQDNQTVEMGDEIPNYTAEYLVSFEDNCGGTLDYNQTPTPGTEISQQTTIVSITATDEAGNVSEACSFDLVVEDDEELFIDCPGTQTADFQGNCEFELLDYTGDADFTSGANVTQSPMAGTFVAENTEITLMAELDGETRECTFIVEANNQRPALAISCPGDQTEDADANDIFEVPDYTNLANVANSCGDINVSQSPIAGTEVDENTTITLSVVDDRGVSVECEFEVILSFTDSYAPKFEDCPTFIQRNVNTDECQALVVFDEPTASNDSGELAVELVSDLGSGDLFPVGSTTVTYQATGENGETATCSFEVVVVDKKSPEIISCPDNIKVEIDADENSIPVTYTEPEFTDNCGIVDIQRNGPASGESFTLGSTTVTYTANDEEGNEISCSFDVLVKREDETGENLNIACQIDQNVSPEEDCTYTLLDYTNTAQVSISGATITQSPPAGTVITENTQIKLIASLNGETDYCNFMVNLHDGEEPKANCVSGYVLELGEDGTASLDGAALDNNSTDNCVIVSRSVSPQNFTRDDVGEVSVRLTVRDAAGNQDFCETVIKVVDKGSSDFKCKENVSVSLNENGNATLAVEELYTGDASGINFGKNEYQFSCADIGAKTIQLNYSGRIEGSCPIKIEVKDELVPTINTNLIDASLDEDGFFYLDESMIAVEDNCDAPLQITLEKTVFTCEDVGQNSIEVEVKDASGNKTSKQITVIVSGEPCEPDVEFSDIRISPNPSAGIFKIGTPTDIQINEVRVFDSRGRFIVQKDYSTNSRFYKLNLESLEESVYTLQIFTNNGEFVKRIIIKR